MQNIVEFLHIKPLKTNEIVYLNICVYKKCLTGTYESIYMKFTLSSLNKNEKAKSRK